ncbi:hypothetical protein QBC46DRAFT_345384 [Diplogelasinospora grovesii]|uniref:Uncharacterized protein n=1 Tax=Diplogelasinospora grovesii TaxID=303347 RepID=A0AAN6N3E2_9PEZI|nr:hypothetical protein QBC46DRAFT_345384 [Diplogelasinospora grovesii]
MDHLVGFTVTQEQAADEYELYLCSPHRLQKGKSYCADTFRRLVGGWARQELRRGVCSRLLPLPVRARIGSQLGRKLRNSGKGDYPMADPKVGEYLATEARAAEDADGLWHHCAQTYLEAAVVPEVWEVLEREEAGLNKRLGVTADPVEAFQDRLRSVGEDLENPLGCATLARGMDCARHALHRLTIFGSALEIEYDEADFDYLWDDSEEDEVIAMAMATRDQLKMCRERGNEVRAEEYSAVDEYYRDLADARRKLESLSLEMSDSETKGGPREGKGVKLEDHAVVVECVGLKFAIDRPAGAHCSRITML